MNGSQRPGGDTFIVEADVIFHTVNSDLASFAGVDKKTCPGLLVKDNNAPLIGQFLQCNQPVNSNAPATLEREYLLDGKKMSLRDQTGDSLCVTKDHQFQMSNHKAGLEITDAINRNGLSGKMGNGISGSFGHPDSGQGAESTLGTKEPDLVIEVGGQKINAHKSILAAKSDYFKARLSRDILKVKGLSYKTLSVLIDYIYTSQINVSKDNVVDVITGAKILQVPCAVQAAMDSMSQQITAENCYEILCIAKKQRLQELKETAYCFMSDNFLARSCGTPRVFDRAGAEPPRPLREPAAEPPISGVRDVPPCNYLFVAGGIKGSGEKGKVSDRVFYYNPVNNRWTEVRPMNQARAQLKLAKCLFTVEKYDPRTDRWTAVAPLPKGAFAVAHEATTCSGELYVSGGSLFYRLLKYDSKRDEWQECPYNSSRKRSSDMVALKSFIYRFDVNREQGINVFKYNTIVKMWHDCASQRLGKRLTFRTLRFVVEEESAYFVEELLRAPLEAKGVLKADTVA
ncbi:hypothetical protein CRUP_007362 [Coryphaenoides rupestris]|nr:hypothetical protein CRUP_007362 [Coryphaenoides rupestris]